MAEITAKMVADLRAATGLGMMECKKALVEAEGNMEKAESSLPGITYCTNSGL